MWSKHLARLSVNMKGNWTISTQDTHRVVVPAVNVIKCYLDRESGCVVRLDTELVVYCKHNHLTWNILFNEHGWSEFHIFKICFQSKGLRYHNVCSTGTPTISWQQSKQFIFQEVFVDRQFNLVIHSNVFHITNNSSTQNVITKQQSLYERVF